MIIQLQNIIIEAERIVYDNGEGQLTEMRVTKLYSGEPATVYKGTEISGLRDAITFMFDQNVKGVF